MNTKTTGGGSAAPGPCPDLETLASFVDGNLTAAERTRVVEHLADCARCAETVAEAMQILGEAGLEETEDEADPAYSVLTPPSLRPSARLRRAFRWGAVAVPLAATLALVLLNLPQRDRDLARRAVAGAPADFVLEGGLATFRGSAEAGDAAGFRVGVVATDLAAAIALEKPQQTRDFASQAALEVSAIALGLDDLTLGYQDLAARIGDGAIPSEAARQAALLEAGSRKEFDETVYDLGRWAEAGRLAARSGNSAYFTDRRTIRQSRSLARADLPDHLAARVSAISDRLSSGNVDLEALESEFGALIRAGSQ